MERALILMLGEMEREPLQQVPVAGGDAGNPGKKNSRKEKGMKLGGGGWGSQVIKKKRLPQKGYGDALNGRLSWGGEVVLDCAVICN